MQLRESTKLALKSSWDEVELLQNTNSSQAGTISNLNTEIAKLKEELKTARYREKDLLRRNDKFISKLAASRNAPFYKTVFSGRRRSVDTLTQNINNTIHDFRHHPCRDPTNSRRNSMLAGFKMESFSTPQLVVHNDADEDSSITTASSTGNNNLDFPGQIDDTVHSYPYVPSRRKKVSFQDANIIPGAGKILRRVSADNLSPASPLVLPISSEISSLQTSKISPSPVTLPATPSEVLNLDNRSQKMRKELISDDEKDMKIEELKFKLKSRDDVINSMEETMTAHIKNMQELHVTSGKFDP